MHFRLESAVFSARTIAGRDWLAQLGLTQARVHTVKLGAILLPGIVDLLRRAGGPPATMADDPDFVRALSRKSQGDPFFLQFLVRDMEAMKIGSLEDLQRQPAGLKEYLDRWWDAVKLSASEKSVRDLLGYLLVSRGGLARDELTTLSDDDAIDGFTVDAAIDRLDRYVIGDASGYALCHPRFKDYLAAERIKQPDQRPYRERLLTWCAGWEQHRSRYALTHYAGHLREAIETSPAAERQDLTKRLVRLLANFTFQEMYVERIDNLPALREDFDAALSQTATLPVRAALPLVVECALALVRFRETWLQPKALIDAARAGHVEKAEHYLGLFDVEEHWRQVALLVIAWCAADADKRAAGGLLRRNRRLFEAGRISPLVALLHGRVLATLYDDPAPMLTLPYPPGKFPDHAPTREEVRAMIDRMGSGNSDTLISGFESVTRATYGADAEPVYIAEGDSPRLVRFAMQHPEGPAALAEYISLHAANPYREYRNRSLWAVLGAALCDPQLNTAREFARAITVAALAGGTIQYREALLMTEEALRARTGDANAKLFLDACRERARQVAAMLDPLRTRSDSWGHHARRLSALAVISKLVFGHADVADDLLDQAAKLPFGFAGFQASASRALAEANLICRPQNTAALQAALAAALRAAHNVQEALFCAQTTARINAISRRWWNGTIASLPAVIERFTTDPFAAEFAPLYIAGEGFDQRRKGEQTLPLPPSMLAASTLARIARDIFQRPLAEFTRLNPAFGGDDPLPTGTEIQVPDAGFAPLLAARFSAEALAQREQLGIRAVDLIKTLVPLAAGNPTALDTVLSRLLLAADLRDPQMLSLIRGVAPADWMVE